MRYTHMTLSAWLFGLSILLPRNGSAEVRVTKAFADGREIPLSVSSYAKGNEKSVPLKFESSSKTVAFRFETSPTVGAATRLKYKLEGIDQDWHDLESHMVVWLRAINRKGQVVGGDSVYVTGESPGWNGRPEDAPLTPFRMTVTASPLADRFRIYFISNGNTPVIGQMVVDDVIVSLTRPDGQTVRTLSIDCTDGEQMDRPHGIPKSWNREGERPELAQVLSRTVQPKRSTLFLNDDDRDKFGVWCSRDGTVPFEPGDRLTMECKIAYSIGSGATNGVAHYEKLKPGTYWFRVATFQVSGQPTGEEVSLPVVVVPPLYQRAEFWLALMLATGAMILFTLRKVMRRRMQRRLAQAEHARLIEAERTRIARDIHDDLGATLSQVAMLSEMARVEADDPKIVRGLLGDIFSSAHSATRSLDEIVWAIKPENDTLESLIRYLCQFAERYLKLAGLSFRLDAPENVPPYTLTSTQRHNLFLAAKEALHNTVKHACATEIWMRITVSSDVLYLSIEDNGTGRVPGAEEPPSRGSANMRNRLVQIGGSYTRTGIPGQGTTVVFQLTMKPGQEKP